MQNSNKVQNPIQRDMVNDHAAARRCRGLSNASIRASITWRRTPVEGERLKLPAAGLWKQGLESGPQQRGACGEGFIQNGEEAQD